MEYIQVPAPDFSFEEVALDKAKEIKKHYLYDNNLLQFYWGANNDLLMYVENEILSLNGSNEILVCIVDLLNFLTLNVETFKKYNKEQEQDFVEYGKSINRIKYKLYSIASTYANYNFDKNAFTNEEASDITDKIDAISVKLDEIKLGHEILYDEINELKTDLNSLKSDMPLGKKRFYQRATGIVVGFAGTKGSDLIFDEGLKPLLTDLLHHPEKVESLIHKLLG